MALSVEEAKKLAEEQGDSRKGGVNVKIGDKTVNMSYEDFSAGGGQLGSISGEHQQVYTDPAGPSINFDKENNRITIKAPQSVLDSQSFKDTYGSSQFKMLAKAYINSPDNKLTLTDGSETTAATQMEQYQNALSQMAEDRPILDNILSNLEDYYGIKGATDQQAVIANSTVDDKSSNKAAVYLPAQSIGGFDFSQLESFDANNLTISKEDFDKFNQMRAFDDEHAKRTREEAQAALKTLSQIKDDENYEYTDESREEAVRWISFYNNLAGNKTKESAAAAVGNFINFGIAKCGEAIFDTSDMIGKLTEKIGEGVPTFTPATKYALISTGKTFQVLAALGDMFESMSLDPQRFTGDQTWDGFSKLWTDVKDIMGADLSEEEISKAEALETDITTNTMLRQTLSGGAVAGGVVGGLVGELIKQLTIVNPVGGAISTGVSEGVGALIASGRTAKTISGLSKFAGVLGEYGTAEEIAAFGETALNLTRSSVILSTGESMLAAGVGKLADVASQGIIDTLTQDSEAMRKLYENGDTSDIAEELTSNFIWNAIGEAGAFGGSKFISFLGDTKVGRGVRLFSGKAVNEFGALKNEAKLKLENMMGEWKGLKDNVGSGTRVFTERIIDAQKEAAGAKTLKELETAVKKRIDLENQFDSILKGKNIEYAIMKANPVLGEAITNYRASVTELSSAIVKNGDSIMPGSKVSQEVANYLSTKMHLSRALADPKTANSKWAADLQARFDQLQSSLANKSILELADKNYDAITNLNKRLTDYAVKGHIISAEDIESLRNTGYWGKEGENYFHTQIIKTGVSADNTDEIITSLEGYRKSVSENSYREFHAKEGKIYELSKQEVGADFIDPNLIMEGSIYQVATDVQAKKWGMALLNSSKVSKVLGGVDATKAQSKITKDLERFRKDMLSNIKKKTGTDYQISLDEMFPDVQATKTANAEELKALREQKAKASRAYNKATDTYAGMQLDANDLAEIEVGIGATHPIPSFDPGEMTEESFGAMIDSLDRKSKQLLNNQIKQVVGDDLFSEYKGERGGTTILSNKEINLLDAERQYHINEFQKSGTTLSEDYVQTLNQTIPDEVDGVRLSIEDKQLLSGRDSFSTSYTQTADLLQQNRGDLSQIADNEFYKYGSSASNQGATLKNLAPYVSDLSNKIHNNSVKRGKLYRIEPQVGQDYKVGQKFDASLKSFSSSKNIMSSKGGFVTTPAFAKSDAYYIIETKPGKIGSLDVSSFAGVPAQKEILVSDQFEVVSADKIPTPKGMTIGRTTDIDTYKITVKQITPSISDSKLTLENYRLAYDSIDDLDTLMRRSYITNNTKIKNTKTYKDTIRRVKSENDNFRNSAFLDKYQQKYDAIVERYKDLKENPFSLKNGGESLTENVKDMMKGTQETLANRVKETASGRNVLEAFTDAGIDEDTTIQYLVVDSMYRMKGADSKEVRDSILNYLRSEDTYKGVAEGDLQEFADIVQNMSDEVIESEWNTMTRSLIDNGYQDLVDIDEVFRKVESYAQDIIGKTQDSASHIIQTFGPDGKLQFVETDPLTKDLYEWRPNYSDSTPSMFFSLTNRVFKQFTSGILSVKSLFTQGVKDPINTYVAGGAVPFLDRGMSRFFGGDAYAKISDTVVESLQSRVIANLKVELGEDGWRVFERQATEQGLDLGRAAVEYELITRPQAIAGVGGTETKFYQDISKAKRIQNAYEFGGVVSDAEKGVKFSDKLSEFLEKAENASPANARETYLRNVVYQEQFSQAIKNGKSVSEARAIAERYMADATTNFSRPLAMGNRIARSIPYLSASFNGKASFMRLLEIDPTGVAGRLFGGVILPYMSLLAESLGKEENREVYKNLTESDKADKLTFVSNGTRISIPMPEELSAFVSPFRQAIEKMADANDHSWTELAVNDLLQLPVLDLTGYYDIDANELSNNTTFWDNLARGTEKLAFGQMAPALVKSTYMAITGRDPYYGSEIDKSHVYDAGDGTVQTMDSNDNKVAVAVSNWAKSIGIDLSASAAYSIIGATFGKGLLNLGDSLASLLSGEPTSVAGGTVKGVVGVFEGEVRDKGADAWRSEVNAMFDEKEALMNTEEYQKYVQAINNTQISEDKRQEYISNWRTYIQDYAKRVVDTANKMKDTYGLTVAQQASVISLLTFSSNDTPTFNASDRSKSQEMYYTARSLAIETLQQLGFTGSNDLSIFGYGSYVMNYETGEYEYKYKYNSPMAILDMGDLVWSQSEITLGNITQLIEGSSGIKEDLKTLKAERQKLYDQANSETDKKKKSAIYDQIDDMNEKWSNRVMRAIVPYIDNYGLDDLLNNREVISYLEQYIQVPSDLMGDAKYMSQKKTGLDKNAGFAQSYIKKWYELYQKEQKKGK